MKPSKLVDLVSADLKQNDVLRDIREDIKTIEILLKRVEDIDERMAYETGSAGAFPEIREIRKILAGL